MGKYDRLYDAFKLPPKQSEDRKVISSSKHAQNGSLSYRKDDNNGMSLDEGMYYEIEYDSTPMPGVGKFVLRTQKIAEPEKDEVRVLFNRMRDIARDHRLSAYASSKFYQDKVRQENSEIFYKQGVFMKDFEDCYEETTEYKQYFPYYQMMGYRQLRTYFTWRTQVRKGIVGKISLSYAYLYLYELLNNIGVADPQDGLDKLLFFWDEFRVFEPSIDKYVIRWLKDYHIYYDLPQPFREFVRGNELIEYYPELAGHEDRFDLFCTLSKYDIRKSRFFTKERETLIRECFDYTLGKLSTLFSDNGIDLESIIFFPTKSLTRWIPFRDALFFPWMHQRDRKVAFSSKETYVCSGDQWFYQTALTTESGKQLAGYILKQMESVLRQTVKYKHKITAGISMLHPATLTILEDAGISLEQGVTDAVKEFYREATKTVVTVDTGTLAKIRREAQETQEKLLVSEDADELPPLPVFKTTPLPGLRPSWLSDSMIKTETQHEDIRSKMTRVSELETENSHGLREAIAMELKSESPWKDLRLALTQTEQQALMLILQDDTDIRQFANELNIMPEVLADGINEKAVDAVGDSLLDDEFSIYDDYLEQVKEMLL